MRHVGLVALEALLIAVIVWVAAMTLAGATQNGGIVGAAAAGDNSASLSVAGADLGGTAVLTAHPGDEGTWVHAKCVQASSTVLSAWVRIDASHHAPLPVARSPHWSSGGATCVAEEGYFSTTGRWRVIVSTTFMIDG